MKNQEIKFNDSFQRYSIIIGNNLFGVLRKKIRLICPNTKQIAIIYDSKVPSKFRDDLKSKLRNYKITFLKFNANEKTKSFKSVARQNIAMISEATVMSNPSCLG